MKRQSLSSYDPQAKALLSKMTLEEKVGQMIQANTGGIADPSEVQTYFLGAILSGGCSKPADGAGLEAWTDLYETLQKQALSSDLAINSSGIRTASSSEPPPTAPWGTHPAQPWCSGR